MGDCEYSIPFQVEVSKAEEVLQGFLIMQETTPLDIAYKFSIRSIVKEMYPIYYIDVLCQVEWEALSIYEKVTYIPVQKSKTVFVDRMGGEHSWQSYDYIDGKKVPYTPQQKIITELVPKVEVASKCRTKGITEQKRFNERAVCLSGARHTPFDDWIETFAISKKLSKKERVSGARYIKPTDNLKNRVTEIKENAVQTMNEMAKKQVPGDRFSDFKSYERSAFFIESVYVPVYHITYTYNNQEYDLLISGIDKTKLFYYSLPQESNIVQEKNVATEAITVAKRQYRVCLCMSIIYFLIALVLFIIGICAWEPLIYILFGLCFISAGSAMTVFAVKKRKQLKELETETKVKLNKLKEIRKRIRSIMKDPEMCVEKKEQEIKKVIINFQEKGC